MVQRILAEDSQVVKTVNGQAPVNGNVVVTTGGVTANSVTDTAVASNAAISADKLADGSTKVVMTATERATLATAATAAAAAQSGLTAKLNQSGAKTIAGTTDFTTLPTVNSVGVVIETDLDDFIPSEQAATINTTDLDDSNTGDVVITAGGKAFTFSYLAGELQGGMAGEDPGDGGDNGDGTGWETFVISDHTPGTMPSVGSSANWPNAKSGAPAMVTTAGGGTVEVLTGGWYLVDNASMVTTFASDLEIEPTSDTVTAFAVKLKDARIDNGGPRIWLAGLCGADNNYKVAVNLAYDSGAGLWHWNAFTENAAVGADALVTEQSKTTMDAGLPQAPYSTLPWPGWVGELTIGVILRPGGGATASQFYVNGTAVMDLDVSTLGTAQILDLSPLKEFGSGRGNQAIRRCTIFAGGSNAQALAMLADVQAT